MSRGTPSPFSTFSRRPWRVFLVGMFWMLASIGRGQASRPAVKVYPDSSHQADLLLRNAENLVRGGQFLEALEIYDKVIRQFGDKVVEVSLEGDPSQSIAKLFVDARRDCQRRIAALPPAGRALYRGRVDAQAERRFKQGKEERDLAILRRIVDETFCGSWGDDALELLGDFAFQEGRFNEALDSYRGLVPDNLDNGYVLVHPDPSVDLARVAAKKLLARVALGVSPPGEADLKKFAETYPNAEGSLAGRKGAYVEIVRAAAAGDQLSPPSRPDDRWPTFAGSLDRNRSLPGSVDIGSLQWKIELETVSVTGRPSYQGRRFNGGMGFTPSGPISLPQDRLLAYFPIIVGEQVVICDDRQVVAFDLNRRPAGSGSATGPVPPAWKHELFPNQVGAASRANAGLPRFTLTAYGDRIYARLGSAPAPSFVGGFGWNRTTSSQAVPSHIVALERSSQGKLLWKRSADEIVLPKRRADNPKGGSRTAVFEGSPVADERNVYVAMTDRMEMTSTYIACLDANSGEPRWVRYVCEANASNDPFMTSGYSPEAGHRLLTLDGSSLFYQTNLGAVASVNAETGGIRWLATYPWQSRGMSNGHERDLNPAVFHDGLVIVAPDDAASMFAFDAVTGRMVWKTNDLPEEVKLTHLLGVAKGKVVATGDRVLLFDAKTGKLFRSWPDSGPAPHGFGRGLLAADRIYWPTKSEIHILDQETGLRSEPSIKLQEAFQTGGGNLAAGDGYLVVTQPDAMFVFAQNRRLIRRYRDEIARFPDLPLNYYRLAQAAETSGMDELALESLGQVLAKARASESVDGSPLVELARDRRYRILFRLGHAARSAKDWSKSFKLLDEAAGEARSDPDRLSALLESAEARLDAGESERAVAAFHDILSDDRIRPLIILAGDGRRSVRADLLIQERLSAIAREHGRAPFARFDQEAARLLDRGVKARDSSLLEDLVRRYPLSLAVSDAWLSLGKLHEEGGKFTEATRSYKRVLSSEGSDATKARASLLLAAAYESRRLWASARDAYESSERRYGGLRLDDLGATVSLVVRDRLAKSPFSSLGGEGGGLGMTLPLERKWDSSVSNSQRILAAVGRSPVSGVGRLFVVSGTVIRPVARGGGESPWAGDVGSEPISLHFLADRLLVITRAGFVALGLEKGEVLWRNESASKGATKESPNPFGKGDSGGSAEDAGRSRIVKVVGHRVITLDSGREMFAIDGDTGLVEWSFRPASGKIGDNFLAGDARIVLQVVNPNSVLVLETQGGRRRSEFISKEDEEWLREPFPVDDDHVVVVPNPKTVASLNLSTGDFAWVFQESQELPSRCPPRLFGDAECLLVLHNGLELIRLDARSGARKWARLLGEENLGERPDAIAVAGDRFYYADRMMLKALSLADGAIAWERILPGPSFSWSISLTDRYVAAYPNPEKHGDRGYDVVPLIFRSRESGDLVQRLVFRSEPKNLAIDLAPEGVLVGGPRGIWALGGKNRSGSSPRSEGRAAP